MTQAEIVLALLERRKEAGVTQSDAKKALQKAHMDTPGFKLGTAVTTIRVNLGYQTVISFRFPGQRNDRYALYKYAEGEIPHHWWRPPRAKKPTAAEVKEKAASIQQWINARNTVTLTARACRVIAPMMLWPQALPHERAAIVKLMEELMTWADDTLSYAEQRTDDEQLREKIASLRKKAESGRGNTDNEMKVATEKVKIYEQRLLEVQSRNGHH